MNSSLTRCAALAATIVLVGCAGTPLTACRTYEGEILASDEVAVLHVVGNRTSEVVMFDRKPVMDFPGCDYSEIEMRPGQHEVHAMYVLSHSVLGPTGSDPVALTFEAEPGHSYELVIDRTGLLGWTYSCSIEDRSTGLVVAKEDPCEEPSVKGQAWLDIQTSRAECGDEEAAYESIEAYQYITFLPRENVKESEMSDALFWCLLVESQGWDDPLQCRSRLSEVVSVDDMARAKKLVAEWHPSQCSPPFF